MTFQKMSVHAMVPSLDGDSITKLVHVKSLPTEVAKGTKTTLRQRESAVKNVVNFLPVLHRTHIQVLTVFVIWSCEIPVLGKGITSTYIRSFANILSNLHSSKSYRFFTFLTFALT